MANMIDQSVCIECHTEQGGLRRITCDCRQVGHRPCCLTKHRIANVGDDEMRFVEIQTGPVLSEDDIVRYEDVYGRN